MDDVLIDLAIGQNPRETGTPVSNQQMSPDDLAQVFKTRRVGEKFGPYCCAPMANSCRKGENALPWQLFALDFDGAEGVAPDMEITRQHFAGVLHFGYTTHSYTKGNGKHRIVLLLDRKVTPAEYRALYEAFADTLPYLPDHKLNHPDQPVFLPSCSPEGVPPYAWRETGKAFCVDDFLAESEHRRTMETRATASYRPAAQPDSVIAAFNEAHDLGQILEQQGYRKRGKKYLHPHSGSGVASVSLLGEGTLAYSHSSTDPLGDGQAHDAFDVWAILVHGGDKHAATLAAADLLGMSDKPQSSTKARPAVRASENTASLDDDRAMLAPPVMAAAGFMGRLGEFVEIATRSSEASPVAVAANLMAGLSAAMGRGPYQPIGDGVCHCRPFFLLCGRTAKARKGTAEHAPKRILRAMDDWLQQANPGHWRLRMHDGGLSSGEGIGFELRDAIEDKDGNVNDPGQPDKRLLITEPEFAGVLAAASREKSTLSAVVRNLWDGRDIAPLVKNGKWKATAPHGVIVGHITAAELVAKLSEVEARNGFLNRFVVLHVARNKLVPFPEPMPQTDVDRMGQWLKEVLLFATRVDGKIVTGAHNTLEMTFTPAARKFWEEQYPDLTKDADGLVGALLARSEIYCRLFAMIFALLDCSAQIDRPHLEAALAWIDYWRGSVSYIFLITHKPQPI